MDRNIRMKHSQDKLIDFAYGDDSMDWRDSELDCKLLYVSDCSDL